MRLAVVIISDAQVEAGPQEEYGVVAARCRHIVAARCRHIVELQTNEVHHSLAKSCVVKAGKSKSSQKLATHLHSPETGRPAWTAYGSIAPVGR